MKIKNIKKVHFVGIGGIGMSALARMFINRGINVSGSDSSESELTNTLESEGVDIVYSQVAENINDDIDLVVYTDAMPSNAPELVRARELKIPTMSYFEALGEVSKDYKVIAIAGTHGKTTTTAMAAKALIQAGLNPTVIVGSLMDFGDGIQTNFRAGKSKYLLVEACEYKRHFLNLHPYILTITNIELDHTDYYKDLKDVEDAFAEFASQSEIVLTQDSWSKYMLRVPDLNVIGEYNKQNAALVLAICDVLNIDLQVAKMSLEEFNGTWRRFEHRGKTKNGALVYDDYAHHPTAIKATLKAVKKEFKDAKIIAIFESHTYSRTEKFMDDFAQSFSDADEVIVAPIYTAREEKINGVNAKIVAEKISLYNKNVQYSNTLQEALSTANSIAKEDDVIMVLGAGDLFKYVDDIVI
ncbi:MAG: UDP-N-acetylmuramate--L-alanine ligase [Candidatus Pacebacteria bacterium]|nr:UDP-N-acetylmuramate--L-alanine ligase [Candidatus Paceibacterota bacterium]